MDARTYGRRRWPNDKFLVMNEPTIISFFVDRQDPRARGVDYAKLMSILQHSCNTLGLRHFVLTDYETMNWKGWPASVECLPFKLPRSLMQASCEAAAQYLETKPDTDTLFVGVDCIMRGLPSKFYPKEPELCVTFRGRDFKYPINFGAMLVRKNTPNVTELFRQVASRCEKYWCADQQAMIDLLKPMPFEPCIEKRRGILVGFLPMWPFNVLPVAADEIDEPFDDICMLHFRGKLPRKNQMLLWAERHLKC